MPDKLNCGRRIDIAKCVLETHFYRNKTLNIISLKLDFHRPGASIVTGSSSNENQTEITVEYREVNLLKIQNKKIKLVLIINLNRRNTKKRNSE